VLLVLTLLSDFATSLYSLIRRQPWELARACLRTACITTSRRGWLRYRGSTSDYWGLGRFTRLRRPSHFRLIRYWWAWASLLATMLPRYHRRNVPVIAPIVICHYHKFSYFILPSASILECQSIGCLSLIYGKFPLPPRPIITYHITQALSFSPQMPWLASLTFTLELLSHLSLQACFCLSNNFENLFTFHFSATISVSGDWRIFRHSHCLLRHATQCSRSYIYLIDFAWYD